MTEFYYDDPVQEPVKKRKNSKSILASVMLLFAGGLFLNTTPGGKHLSQFKWQS